MRKKAGTIVLFALSMVLCFMMGFLVMELLKSPLGLRDTETETLPNAPESSASVLTDAPETENAVPYIPEGEPQSEEKTPQEQDAAAEETPVEQEEDALRDMSQLQDALDERLSNMVSDWAVYFHDLSGQREDVYSYVDGYLSETVVAKNTPMVSASLIKLWIMAAVYDRAESEGDTLDESTRALIGSMITVSDNDAANSLVTNYLGSGDAQAGMDAVNSYARSIGCQGTTMSRLMLDTAAQAQGKENYTTVTDCAKILEMIYSGQCVSEKASKEMLDTLRQQTRTGKIPAGLPEGVESANKTGELAGLAENDAAIVFTDSGDYILVVMCMSPLSNSSAIGQITAISSDVYKAYTEQ